MAAADCTVFAVKGQAVRVYGWIKSSATGLPLDISAATMSSVISGDAATGAAGPTPTKVASMTGRFYVELSTSQNNFYNVGLIVSSNASNNVDCTIDITNCDLSEPTGHWLTQTVKRLEQGIAQIGGYLFNYNKRDKVSGTITLYKLDGTTEVGTMARVDETASLGKGELTNA